MKKIMLSITMCMITSSLSAIQFSITNNKGSQIRVTYIPMVGMPGAGNQIAAGPTLINNGSTAAFDVAYNTYNVIIEWNEDHTHHQVEEIHMPNAGEQLIVDENGNLQIEENEGEADFMPGNQAPPAA